jgi:molecular chaperone HtpG
LKARTKDAGDYAKFWENFGPILKEGVWEDTEHRKDLAPLLRFRSSAVEGWTSLPDYVARMKPGQEAIFTLAGDDPEILAASPQLEGFRARGLEVLLLPDQVDAFWPERLDSFEGKPLRSISQGTVDLSKVAPEAGAAEEAADLSRLLPLLKAALEGAVSDVRATERLVESAVVLAAPEGGPDLHMQRLLRRAGRRIGAGLPVLEINPRHPLVQSLASQAEAGGDLAEAAGILFDLACVQDGDSPRDPAAFARRVAAALTKGFGQQ